VTVPTQARPTRRAAMKAATGALVVWASWVASVAPIDAHRLDEYLQATRIALGPDAVDVEIDLTPGVAIASSIYASIDADHDGQLSSAERDGYAGLVVSSAVLTVDGARERLDVVTSEFPSLAEMSGGGGMIRLTAHASLAHTRTGARRLYFRNGHRPDVSVYLVNALVPPKEIRIAEQRRDPAQHEVTIDYRVASTPLTGWTRVAQIALGLGVGALLAGACVWFRRNVRAARPA
jgi:hypothetical protein